MTSAPDFTSTLLASFLQFGAFGALVAWIVLRVIPKMQADCEQARHDFKDALDKQQTVFVEEMRLEREAHAGEMRHVIERLDHLSDRVDEGRGVRP